MVWFWHWAIRATFAAAGTCAFLMAAAGIIEWSLGLSTFAACAIVADAAHHVGNRAKRRRHRKLGIVEAPAGHSFFDYTDYERPSEKRAA
jgi:hypothetical protein